MNDNQKKSFRTFNVYKTANGGFYAIAEGNLTRDPSFSNSEDKTSFISSSIGCGEFPISTTARRAGMAIPEDVNINFANLKFFGKKAKALFDNAKKGDKLVVAGKAEYSSNESNGKTYHNLTINVDEFTVRSKGKDDVYSSGGIARFTNVYTSAGTEKTSPTLANFIGEVMSVDSSTFTRNGEERTRVNLNIKTENDPRQAYDLATGTKGEDYKSNGGYMYVTMFGKTAERALKCLHKGSLVAFTGNIRSRKSEDTGKVYYDMTADTFVILKWADSPEESAEEPNRELANNNKPADETPKSEASSAPEADDDSFSNDFDDEDEETLPF